MPFLSCGKSIGLARHFRLAIGFRNLSINIVSQQVNKPLNMSYQLKDWHNFSGMDFEDARLQLCGSFFSDAFKTYGHLMSNYKQLESSCVLHMIRSKEGLPQFAADFIKEVENGVFNEFCEEKGINPKLLRSAADFAFNYPRWYYDRKYWTIGTYAGKQMDASLYKPYPTTISGFDEDLILRFLHMHIHPTDFIELDEDLEVSKSNEV